MITNEIMYQCPNAYTAMMRAEEIATEIDQDWEYESTLYTFADESVLVVSGPQCNVYDSMSAARAAIAE